MDDAAVVSGLVRREALLLLEDHDAALRVEASQTVSGRQADDAAADDRYVR